MRKLRLGTRRSALALAQSTQIKLALEAAHPGLTVELTGMDTQGDEVHQNRFSTEPLASLDGKNFFVKELDEALLNGTTDLSVHSYKDLSLERPAGIMLAAIPPRANPRDIVLFHPRITEKLQSGTPVVIGSSSPRRAENTVGFLQAALPQCHSQIKMQPLRGNVNTRIKKLEAGEADGIILALAGLIRLDADIARFPKMILPLDRCPAAPAQGALAIECRTDDEKSKRLIQALHDEPSAASVHREREVLKRFGGGCHQAFGATCVTLAGQPLTFIRGKSDAGQPLDLREWNAPDYTAPIAAWDGTAHRAVSTQTLPVSTQTSLEGNAVFIAHHRAATPEVLPALYGKRLWISGTASWEKLAALGLWVEGCAENLGFASIENMLAEKILTLPPFSDWNILTHQDGAAGWSHGRVISTYVIAETEAAPAGLETATHIYWASGSQFLRLKESAKRAKYHACGPGKTAELLIAHHINPDIFPSVASWRQSVHLK